MSQVLAAVMDMSTILTDWLVLKNGYADLIIFQLLVPLSKKYFRKLELPLV